MKTLYWFFIVIAILMWNGILIRRDKELFDAYEKACSELHKPNPKCHMSQWNHM